MHDGHVQDVVDALLDGDPIDWQALRRRMADRRSLDYCSQLETLSKIGRQSQSGTVGRAWVRESRWVPILLAVATLQIVVGVVGTVAYREPSLLNFLRFLIVLSFGGMGVVLRSNRQNLRARDFGVVFILRACSFSRSPYLSAVNAWFGAETFATILRSGIAADAWTPFFVWRFARRFPASARFTTVDRVAIVATRVTGILAGVLFGVNVWVAWNPWWGPGRPFAIVYEEGPRYSATLYALILPALVALLIRGRFVSNDEKARVRLFGLAMAVGIAPQAIEVLLEAMFPLYGAMLRGSETVRTAVIVLVLAPLASVPLVTGYLVLVHRMLDVRFVIRQGVRYLLARHTLTILTLVPFGLFAAHVYSHRNESVAAVTSGGGRILISLVALGGVLLAGRSFLVKALDRWFDRNSADRSLVLAQMGDSLRLARTRSELVGSVARAVEDALNTTVVMHFFDPQRQAYVPYGCGGLALPDDSALSAILRQEPTLSMLRTDRTDTITRFLPGAERLWLEGANICALAPIRSSTTDRPTALIAFGPRRDAVDYSRADTQFVNALASATGIALENLRLKTEGAGEPSDEEFGLLCTSCRMVVDHVADRRVCTCGGDLQAAAVPRRINSKFLVEALLGSGGMGVAYLATDIVLKRRVAIKTLPTVSVDTLTRLSTEARTMASLSHPNLATILEQQLWRGTPILVCEYLQGGTLQRRLDHGPLAVDEALSLGLTLLEALDYMHRNNVLHRDIKPSNIAFTADGVAKLLDFGLAALVEFSQSATAGQPAAAPSQASTMAGTIAYLPPEAFAGARPTPSFDHWALVVVLFEAIVGHHPFAAGPDTVSNICRRRVRMSAISRSGESAHTLQYLREMLTTPFHPQLTSSSALHDALTMIRRTL